MGSCMSSEPEVDFTGPVDFNHFHILRAIGKGAFGKVCIVKKKDTKQMYAMKYMNKVAIIKKHAVENVFREINILQTLEHPFLVNLWFTFQDREDIFMVLDLMLGGDLSYHLEKEGRFQVPRVRLYVAELAMGLEYLRNQNILHRDVKPANMLLDSQGHVHLTDFNVACVVRPNAHITSITGTKPYMAPEVVHPTGGSYSYPVDWWSLGVSAYEMLRGQRPFLVERNTTNEELYSQLKHTRPSASARWDQGTCDLLKLLLHPDEDKRLQSIEKMKELKFFEGLNWTEVEEKETTPTFIPPQNRINCDPTYELEEMIVEPNPLHKKQHRLSKRRYRTEDDEMERALDKIERRFKVYSREQFKDVEVQETSTSQGGEKASEDGEKKQQPNNTKSLSEIREVEEKVEEKGEGSSKGENSDTKEAEKEVEGEEDGGKREIEGEDKRTVEREEIVEVEVLEQQVEETNVNTDTNPVEDGQRAQQVEDTPGVTKDTSSPVENEQSAEQPLVADTSPIIEDGQPQGVVRTDTNPPEEEKPLLNDTSDKSAVDSNPPNSERTEVEGGTADNGPQILEGDNVESFSSVKHLLS